MKVQGWKSALVLGSFSGDRVAGMLKRGGSTDRGSHLDYGERQAQEKGLGKVFNSVKRGRITWMQRIGSMVHHRD